MVVAGIGGEGLFEYLSAHTETAVRAHDEQILGNAILSAGTAKDSADAAAKAAGRAEAASGAAVDKATAAGTKVDAVGEKTAEASEKISAVSERASAIDGRLGQIQMIVSAPSILNPAAFKKESKPLEGKTIFVRSYGEPEPSMLCAEIASMFPREVHAVNECGREVLSGSPVIDIAVSAPTDEEMTLLMNVIKEGQILGGVSGGPYGKVPHSPVAILFVGTRPPMTLFQGPIKQPPPKAKSSKHVRAK